jgi:ATP-dependent Clp protease ATP-binding subunit ClpC
MSEYMEKHSVSRMVGAPPGYVGYDQGGQLTEIVRRKPFSIILMDEIEKAHPDVFNALLQITEDGRLTDGKGRTVDFKNTIIILTSNVGSELLRKSQIGFDSEKLEKAEERSDFERRIHSILKEQFRPEFLNRIDEIVIFNTLSVEDISKIVQLQLDKTSKLLEDHEVEVIIDKKAKEYLLEKGYSKEYGARPLRRLIQREIENVISNMIISAEISNGDLLEVSLDSGGKKLKISVKQKVKSKVSKENNQELD